MKKIISLFTILCLLSIGTIGYASDVNSISVNDSLESINSSNSSGSILYIDEDGDAIYEEDEPADEEDLLENAEEMAEDSTSSTSIMPIPEPVIILPSEELEFSELDEILFMRESTPNELSEIGVSNQTAEKIASTDIESLFLERAQLSTSDLKSLGYSDKEIEILKNYDGSTITSESPVASVAAECKGKAFPYEASKTKVRFRYRFKWTKCPILPDSDKIAVRWCAYDSHPYAFAVDADHYARVKYWSNNKYYFTDKLKTTYKEDITGCADGCSRKFSVLKNDPTTGKLCWAKKSWITVTLRTVGTSRFKFVRLSGSYGHTYVENNPSIGVSFPAGIGVSFTPTSKVTTIANKAYKFSSNGNMKYLGRTDVD